jgi:protein gp37
MGENSAIEWTGDTWNVVTGCTKVSPACAHCYIERTIPFRSKNRPFVNGHIPLQFHPNRLDVPLRKRKPTVYFVNSLSDLFHEDVPDEFIDRVFSAMALAPRHTFQVLTKRAQRMRDYVNTEFRSNRVLAAMQALTPDRGVWSWPTWREAFAHVWLGCSVENQRFADERVPLLLQTPAAVRFLSCEPVLGAVDLRQFLISARAYGFHRNGNPKPMPERDIPRLDWVIGGAESGPKPRPTNIEWARSLRDQCVAAGVPFFWKQNGGRTSKSGGRELDGRTWDQMPAVSR